MIPFTQFQKFIAVLMLFILLAEFSGCTEYRIISTADLSDYSNYRHSVYGKRTRYFVDSTEIKNGVFKGFIDHETVPYRKSVHVYAISDTLIGLDKENILVLSVSAIDKVKVPKDYLSKGSSVFSPTKKVRGEREPAGKTILTILYAVVGFSVIGSLSWMIFENKRH